MAKKYKVLAPPSGATQWIRGNDRLKAGDEIEVEDADVAGLAKRGLIESPKDAPKDAPKPDVSPVKIELAEPDAIQANASKGKGK